MINAPVKPQPTYDELTASERRMFGYWRNTRKLKPHHAIELAVAGFNGRSKDYEARKREILQEYGII
jgi:hypothetical protein